MSENAGDELKRVRESKGITIQQAANDLFIRLSYLQAIENGHTEIIPSAVQARGFFRMYAEYLGVNPDELFTSTAADSSLGAMSESVSAFVPSSSEQTENFQPQPTTVPIQQINLGGLPPQQALVSSQTSSQTDSHVDTNQDLFRPIGEQLMARRIKLGFSPEECEAQTLIRTYYINAMESGQFDLLPTFIQGKGMLYNYAAFLNLDTGKIMLQFADALQELSKQKQEATVEKEKKRKKKKPAKKIGRLRQFFTPDLFVSVIVLTIMIGIIIYSALRISDYQHSNPTPTTDLNIAFIGNINQSQTPAVDASTATPTQIALIVTPETENTGTAPEETIPMPIQLEIEAGQRTYLHVITDGKDAYVGRTNVGDKLSFGGEQLIEVTTGNAAAISIIYNQQNLGPMGALGEVMTVDYSELMILTPTPRFSPTPTATFRPTYTQNPQEFLPTLTMTPYIP